jgi:hypothetical protein
MTIAQVTSLLVTLVLGLATPMWAIFSWRRSGSKIEVELGFGEVDEEGVLSVYFASGEENIIQLPTPPPSNRDVIVKFRTSCGLLCGLRERVEQWVDDFLREPFAG